MTKRPDGRYRLTVSYEDALGVKRRHAVYGRTQAEVRAKAEEVRGRLEDGAPVRDAARNLEAWITEWTTTVLAASDRSTSTRVLYDRLLAAHIVPVIGHLALSNLRPIDITRALLAMSERGLAGSTARSTYAALRGCLDDAVANGLIASNPTHQVRRPKASSPESRHLTPAEVARFLEAARGLRYVAALRLILGTGLRRGEALAIRWEDVNLERRELRVRGSLVRLEGRLVVSTPKTSASSRVIALSSATVTLLGAQRAAQARERLRAANQWHDEGFVFTTEVGRPVDPRNLLRESKIAARRAGLDDLGVHTLRHTYATTALLGGVPLHVVSRHLGHSSIAVTADIYAHLTDAASQHAADTVAQALGL